MGASLKDTPILLVYEHRVKIFQPTNLYFLALPFGGFSDCTLENKGSQPLTHHLLSKKSQRQVALPAIGLPDSLGDQTPLSKSLQDTAQMTSIQSQFFAEFGRCGLVAVTG